MLNSIHDAIVQQGRCFSTDRRHPMLANASLVLAALSTNRCHNVIERKKRIIVPPGLEGILNIDPEVMHGDLCFAGTRVPLTILLDNLTEGMGIDEFIRHYPTITREQVEAVLNWEHNKIRHAAGLLLAS